MTTRSDIFSSEALRASLRRRLVEVDRVGGEKLGWTEADVALASTLYTWLGRHKDVRTTLPTTGISIDGLPDLDWTAVALEELSRAAATGQQEGTAPDYGGMTRADLRIAIRRRLTDREVNAQPGPGELNSDDARCLLDLYEYITQHHDAPSVDVPADVVFDGHPDVDWNSISPGELSDRVRHEYARHRVRVGSTLRDPAGNARDGGIEGRGTTVPGDDGATVHDPTTYAAFVEQRIRRRADDAQRLLEARQRFREEAAEIREAHFKTAQDLFSDMTMPRSVRAQVLRHHRETLQRELEEHARERSEILGRGRLWYDKLLERWSNERGDRKDYANALKALYEDRNTARRAGIDLKSVQVDPVLIAIPGVRRHRQDGALVYTQRTAAGDAEMFRVFHNTREVVVRSRDPIATEAAIVKAYQLDGPPLTFEGSDQFRARCEAIAARHGFDVAPREASAPNASSRSPQARPAAASSSAAPTASTHPTQSATSSGSAGSSPPESSFPVADLAKYGDVVAYVKEQTGVDFVVALDPKHAVPMEPVYLTQTPMKEGPFDLVFVQKPGVEAISAIVLPRGSVPATAVSGETRVVLEIESGRWKAGFDAPAPFVDRDGPENEMGRSRGR